MVEQGYSTHRITMLLGNGCWPTERAHPPGAHPIRDPRQKIVGAGGTDQHLLQPDSGDHKPGEGGIGVSVT